MDFDSVSSKLRTIPDFDISAFEQLKNDTSELVSLKILARFSVTLKESLNQIELGLENENSEEVRKACHKLVGSSELIGFKEFGKKSRTLNNAIRDVSDVHMHEAELKEYMEAGQSLLNNIRHAFKNINEFL